MCTRACMSVCGGRHVSICMYVSTCVYMYRCMHVCSWRFVRFYIVGVRGNVYVLVFFHSFLSVVAAFCLIVLQGCEGSCVCFFFFFVPFENHETCMTAKSKRKLSFLITSSRLSCELSAAFFKITGAISTSLFPS